MTEGPQYAALGMPRIKALDNLLKQYAGPHYQYDARGNLTQRWHNGKEGRFTWDLFDRLTHYEDERLKVDYTYDALGRRLSKHSQAHYEERREAGPHWNRAERVKRNRALQCGFTLYGWDGDTLAWESKIADEDGFGARTTHYVYEPGSFVPVAQAVRDDAIELLDQPEYGDYYRQDEDPLWLPPPPAPAINSLAWYQCDHLGTPQELTDEHSEIAWSAEYRAWGVAQEAIRKASGKVPIANPIRFQGQYHDHESGLQYNRYRYYDPEVGRFVSKDPIGYAGGLNSYQYAPNPVEWIDPLGLAKLQKIGRYHGPKPEYENPGHHDPSSGVFRGGGAGKTSILPCNAKDLYKQAIPDAEGKHWYALDDNGVVHRFGNSNDGKVHWNGDTSQGRGIELPPEVKRRIDAMKKDGVSSARGCSIGR
ncbi:RHS repeat domain-containing protein [Burkholderia diffusa]|uniref:RHS repeat domain-containing protein n=1 Tax=Burkholderia diffusa TaxID=488732 RepID=UPI00158AC6CE|nr:RHS repeat-associated core domain-containing protein [Burkholderia diffusa]